jgi:hypothetical protein
VPTNTSLFNSRAGYHKIVAVEVALQPGDINTITLGATNSSGKSPLGLLCTMAFVVPRALEGERANCSAFRGFCSADR